MLLNTLLAFTLINVTPQKIKEWGQKKQVLVRVFFFFFCGGGARNILVRDLVTSLILKRKNIKMEGRGEPSPQNKTSSVRMKEILDFGRKNRSPWALKYCSPTPWKRRRRASVVQGTTPNKKKTVQVHMPVHTVLSSHVKGG